MKRPGALLFLLIIFFAACLNQGSSTVSPSAPIAGKKDALPEYFSLRPALEKQYGYTHAVKMGEHLKISGAVSMSDTGALIGAGDMQLQMRNCYKDLEKILTHFGYTFDDVFAENVYTTNMTEFLRVAGIRNSIYKKNFPTGTWLEVKGLALPGQLIEIDMEATKQSSVKD